MKIKDIFLLLALFGFSVSKAQIIDTIKLDPKFEYVVYHSEINDTIKSIQLDTSKTKRDTPENFVVSLASSPNLAFYQKHSLSKTAMSEEDVKENYRITSQYNGKLNIIINSKIYYKIGSVECCLVKLYDNGVKCTYPLQKINGIWYSEATKESSTLDFIFNRFKPEFAKDFFVYRHSIIPIFDEMIKANCKEDGYFYYDNFILDFNEADIAPYKDQIIQNADRGRR